MIQLLGILILFVVFTIIFVVFRVLLVARQLFFGKSTRKNENNTEYNNKPKQEYDEASVKAKRFDKSKAEDVEFEVIKE